MTHPQLPVQVVPDFSHFRADFDAQMKQFQASNAAQVQVQVGIKVDEAKLSAELDAILKRVGQGKSIAVGVHLDTSKADAQITALQARLNSLHGTVGVGGSAAADAGAYGGGGLNPWVLGIGAGVVGGGGVAAGAIAGLTGLVALVGTAKMAVTGLQTQMKEGFGFGPQATGLFNGLKGELEGLEQTAANALGPGLMSGLQRVKEFLPTLSPVVDTLGKSLGAASDYLSQGLVSGLATAKPLLTDVAAYTVKAAQAFADFASSQQFKDFVTYARQELPVLIDTLENLASVVMHVIEAFTPVGTVALQVLKGLTEALDAIPVSVLRDLAVAATAAGIAFGGLKLGSIFGGQDGATLWKGFVSGIRDTIDATKALNPGMGTMAAGLTAVRTGALSVGQALGLGAIGIGAGVIAIQALNQAMAQTAATGQKAVQAITDLTNASNNAFKEAGARDLTSLADLRRNSQDQSGWNKFLNWDPFSAVGLGMPGGTKPEQAANVFKTLDNSLTQLVQGGNVAGAKSQLASVTAELSAQGFSVDYINSKLTQYQQALLQAGSAALGFANTNPALQGINPTILSGLAINAAPGQVASALQAQQSSPVSTLVTDVNAVQQAQLNADQTRASGLNSIQNAQQGVASAIDARNQTEIQGARSVAAAVKSLADVRISAAQSIAAAELSVQQAEQATTQAETNLMNARKAATQQILDAQRAIRDAPLQNESAQLTLAQDQLAQAARTGSMTPEQILTEYNRLQREQNQLKLTQDKNAVTDTRQNTALQVADARRTIAQGINGNPQVVQAVQALNNAYGAEQRAVASLAEAHRKADEQIQASEQALADARENAAHANMLATQAVDKAQQNLTVTTDAASRANDAATKSLQQAKLALADVATGMGLTAQQALDLAAAQAKIDTKFTMDFTDNNSALAVSQNVVALQRKIEETALMAGGMSYAEAVAQAKKDIPDVATGTVGGQGADLGTPAGNNYTYSGPNVAPPAAKSAPKPGGNHPGGFGVRAAGGAIFGPGGPTDDTAGLFALSNGEHVWTAEEVTKLGGHGAMERLRSMVRGYATGGAVDAINFNSLGVVKALQGLIANGGRSVAASAASAAQWVGGLGDHTQLIMQALGLAGVPVSNGNVGDVNLIASYESGWNPNAINLTDSNAAAGHPSQGLMQTIPSTFEAYRLRSLPDQITNPLANLVAGIRYAVSRYGSLDDVPGVASVHNGGGYVGYDEGGWLRPGSTLTLNKTKKPEAVFTNEQFKTLERIANSGGRGPIQHVETQIVNEASDADLIARKLEFAYRSGGY